MVVGFLVRWPSYHVRGPGVSGAVLVGFSVSSTSSNVNRVTATSVRVPGLLCWWGRYFSMYHGGDQRISLLANF